MFSKLWLVYQIQQESTTECRFSARGILLFKKWRISVPKWNFLSFIWFSEGLELASTTLWPFQAWYLHKPGVHQWCLCCSNLSSKEYVMNFWPFESSDWDLAKLSSQARGTSIKSFLFQNVCKFFFLKMFRFSGNFQIFWKFPDFDCEFWDIWSEW